MLLTEKLQKHLLILIFCFALLICSAVAADSDDPSISPIAEYTMPWEYESIAETAVIEGKMHFFFMAGEGMPVNAGSGEGEPEKWGDSCLIAFPNGQLMLIDAGMPKYAPVLVENLRRLGVEKLDYLLITHPHNDHAGAVYTDNGLLDHIQADQAFYNGTYNANWDNPHLLEDVLDAHNVPRTVVSEGFRLEIGDAVLQVISPAADVAGQTFSMTPDINNNSIVLRIDYGDFSALFTGDIYMLKENELVKEKPELLDVDLLKIPHHGHTTSNGRRFGDAVTPQLAVATGRIVLDSSVYYNYTKHGSKVLMDYCDGYIHVTTDGSEISWEHSRERTIDYYDKFEYENINKATAN